MTKVLTVTRHRRRAKSLSLRMNAAGVVAAWLPAMRFGGRSVLSAGRAARLLGVVAVMVGACLALGVAPAFATDHQFSTTFGSGGSGAGQVSNPQSVAVNDSTGDVYVADTGNARVDEFDASGNFIAAWGDAVDQTTGGDLCTAARGIRVRRESMTPRRGISRARRSSRWTTRPGPRRGMCTWATRAMTW